MARVPRLSSLTPDEKDDLIVELARLLETQAARIADLEAQLSGGKPPKTPDNSSLPPSRGHKRNRPPKAKRLRKKRSGPGVTRALAAEPDRVVDCYAERCRHCKAAVAAEGQGLRQAYDHIELPEIRPQVTRVRIYGRRCPGCRRRVRGAPPEAMAPGSPFGPSVVAMLAYLRHHHAVSYERLSGLMAELFGLQISQGAIAAGLNRAARPLGEAGKAIQERLVKAPVIGCDETGARLTTETLGTRMAWEWVLVSAEAVLHRIHLSRGRAVITELLGGQRPRCWVSDRWSAQQGHADSHQVCLAHVLRDVQYAIDCGEPHFAPELRRLLALPTATQAGDNLLRQTKRWRWQFFTFITDRAVPATNNASERALRPSVIHRKSPAPAKAGVTNGFRSLWGADTHALIRSVIGTGRLNGFTPHQAISAALAGKTLFPASPTP